MRFSTLLSYAALPLVFSVFAQSRDDDDDDNDGGYGHGYGGGYSASASSAVASSTSSAATSTSTSATSANATGLTGDTQCSSSMCISANVNGSTVQYVLQSTGSGTPGWMAIGFGSQMSDSPMVIMWSNSDGSVTLSQRTATGHAEPTVDSSPPRDATFLSDLSTTSGSTPEFAFSVPANSDTTQSIIWAYSGTNPDSASEDANLQIHDSMGTLSLDLTKSLDSSSTDPASGGSSSSSQPLTQVQKLVIAHAVLLGVAFLILLPVGALLARWLRTFSPSWFKGHWIIQFYLSGALIVAGVAMGIAAVSQAGVDHVNDDHKRWGIAIFALYFVQCALGGVIHFVKPSPKADGGFKRPPQNYSHAVLGLLIIALAFYQVRTGYKDEWPLLGRGDAPKGVNGAWIAWVVILPILYFAGLVLLPRQYRQERGAQTGRGVPLNAINSNSPRSRTVPVGGPIAAAHYNEGAAGFSPVEDSKYEATSSLGHGDPYADNIGLTQTGRLNRTPVNYSGGYGASVHTRRF